MVAVMWQLDITLTLLAVSVVPFLIACIWAYSGRMNTLSYRQAEAESTIYENVERTLSAMPVVQAFTMEARNDADFKSATDTALTLTLQSNNVQLQFKVLTGLITAVGTAAVIWLGGMHVLQGTSTIGSILVFVAYLSALYGPLETLMYTAITLNQAAGSAQRVVEVLDSDPDVQDSPGAIELTGVEGQIDLENVVFGYEPEHPVLKGVTLSIPAGTMTALVGHTGAGKSSLMSLIPRFFDAWSGAVKIDGTDVKRVRLRSLRDQISIVLQEPFLFPVTVAENIAYGCPGATEEAIRRAAIAANAHEFIERLPNGYSTILGERGATLSGGERQRISIARALLKNAPILLLDEPTSAVDSKTEAAILEALERLTRGRTTVVIAHRLSTIRRADQIVVLDEGMVAESGTHDQLAEAGGIYARMLNRSDRFPE
jgi:ATP-binding cassette subfamily B protein/subfamily B ATP-binding cassette protein MsbA